MVRVKGRVEWERRRSSTMSKRTRRCQCPRCGSVFHTLNPTKSYCQEKCRKSAENSRLYWANKGKKK